MKRLAILVVIGLGCLIVSSCAPGIIISNTHDFKRIGHTFFVEGAIDLNGKNLILPPKATIIFRGGIITNGTITGNNNIIKNPSFHNVEFVGKFDNKEISLSKSSFGEEVEIGGIIRSFQNAKILLESDVNAIVKDDSDIHIDEFMLCGNGHRLRIRNFPIIRCTNFTISNVYFDCSLSGDRFIYGIGKGKFELKDCSFDSIPEINLCCARGFSQVNMENNTLKGQLTEGSKRTKDFLRNLFVYECSGDIVISGNTISNCFGVAINGIGFKPDEASKVNISDNVIDHVSNGGIVINGGEVWNTIVRNNRITDTYCLGKAGFDENGGAQNSAINFHGFRNLVIEDNIIENCPISSSIDLNGNLDKGNQAKVRNNKLKNVGEVAIFLVNDIIFNGNEVGSGSIFADGIDFLVLLCGSKDIKIYDNTFSIQSVKNKYRYVFYANDMSVKSGDIHIDNNQIITDEDAYFFSTKGFLGRCHIKNNSFSSFQSKHRAKKKSIKRFSPIGTVIED